LRNRRDNITGPIDRASGRIDVRPISSPSTYRFISKIKSVAYCGEDCLLLHYFLDTEIKTCHSEHSISV